MIRNILDSVFSLLSEYFWDTELYFHFFQFPEVLVSRIRSISHSVLNQPKSFSSQRNRNNSLLTLFSKLYFFVDGTDTRVVSEFCGIVVMRTYFGISQSEGREGVLILPLPNMYDSIFILQMQCICVENVYKDIQPTFNSSTQKQNWEVKERNGAFTFYFFSLFKNHEYMLILRMCLLLFILD